MYGFGSRLIGAPNRFIQAPSPANRGVVFQDAFAIRSRSGVWVWRMCDCKAGAANGQQPGPTVYVGAGRKSGVDGKYIMSSEWKHRARLFIQRFWQPTSACMTCMPGSWGNVMSLAHWTIAFHTGLLTGLFAVLLTFTPAAKLYGHRYGNALIVGILTAIGDAYSHASHYRIPYVEHLVTGVISALLALIASYLLEDRGRRLRAAWARVVG